MFGGLWSSSAILKRGSRVHLKYFIKISGVHRDLKEDYNNYLTLLNFCNLVRSSPSSFTYGYFII